MLNAAELLQRARGADIARVLAARHHDPHALLGQRHVEGRDLYTVLLPRAEEVVLAESIALLRLPGTDLFTADVTDAALPAHPRVRWRTASGGLVEREDPYSFHPVIADNDLSWFASGHCFEAWRFLGANGQCIDGTPGVLFATWAPEAERVSVVGHFNGWDGRTHPMRARGDSGVWELFLPRLGPGEVYKFEIRRRDTGALLVKADPYARAAESRPATASIVAPAAQHVWTDHDWMARRGSCDWLHAPMSIYEVHLGSWARGPDGAFLGYRALAERLADHVSALGHTHVELLPVTEHPLDASWGYQCTGYFAPTSRHGRPDDFRAFVDHLHGRGIGVILDWVPGHFPKDAHGLAGFDGSPLYEYADPRKGEHRDWGTLVFNYDRREVRSFLLSSACWWLGEFHLDGLRVDAVASMIYLDYSRPAGEWAPNLHGGRENLEATSFLRELNALTHARFPGTVTIAEESTDWPLVSRPADAGGLGFSMKWNMGWMHDTLAYFREDPLYRSHHHDRLTFARMYAFAENFVLPLSHDEVVHLKRSLFDKMPGDDWQRFANLRLLLAWQWCWPGKKLLFMGAEFAQAGEWNHDRSLPWEQLSDPRRDGIRRLLADLNALYRSRTALHAGDFEAAGFEWLDCDDREHSTLAFIRRAGERCVVVACNFTPVPRHGHRLGLPHDGDWREALNSDSAFYGGGNVGNPVPLRAEPVAAMQRTSSVTVTLPPLAAIVLVPVGSS
jgi:1,4-alpha-glucan branching enzyme